MTTNEARWPELLQLLDRGAREPMRAGGSWRVLESDGSAEWEESGFACWHVDGRWLLEQPVGVLRIVGDATRDLLADEGGLRRVPAGDGWSGFPVALLLRPDTWLVGADAVSGHALIEGPELAEIAGRRCWAVTLRTPEKDQPYRLWIDDATGLRLRCEATGVSVALDELVFDPSADGLGGLGLLDLVPDVDYRPVHSVPNSASPYVAAVEAALGGESRVSVLSFSELGSFTLRIDGAELGMAIFDRRPNGHAPQYLSTLGRSLVWGSERWDYALDVKWDYTRPGQGPITEDRLIEITKQLTQAVPEH